MYFAPFMASVVSVVIALSPGAFSEEVNIIDTRESTTDLNWQTSGEWIEMSNDDENQVPLRTFQVCSVDKIGGNSWFRTPFIPLNKTESVYVEIKFTIRSCDDLPHVRTCKETFNLYYLEANSNRSGREKRMNDDMYTKVDTLAADERYPTGTHVTNIETRLIGPLTQKGLYIAFQDTGACMIIFYIRVYYRKCEEIFQNLARFPETISGPKRTSLVKVTGKCVTDAVWTRSNEGPTLVCNSAGRWDVPGGACQCRAGFEPNEDFSMCLECPVGQFKSSIGNSLCKTCPDNSVSVSRASVQCVCSASYYRAPKDSASSPCTKQPSKPGQIEFFVNKTSVSLKWSPPKFDGGRSDIYYSISCFRCDSTFSLCSACSDSVDYEPNSDKLHIPQVTVHDLSPHTNYRFRVYSFNGVSELTGKDAEYSDVKLKTNEAPPSSVVNVRILHENVHDVLVAWSPPQYPNGNILEYEIQYSSSGLKSPVISRTNRTKSQSFRIRYLPSGTAFVVVVRARNVAGYGPYSGPSIFHTKADPSSSIIHSKEPTDKFPPKGGIFDNSAFATTAPNTVARSSTDHVNLIVGIIIAMILLIVVVIALIFVCGHKKRFQKSECSDIEVFPFFNNSLDLVNTTKTQRTYIDPSTYGDPDKAVHEFAKEIDAFSIKKEELMGSGEFGDVYKGYLRPTTPILDETSNFMTSTFKQSCVVVAIKTLKPEHTDKQKEDFLTEASIMGQFDHPNVIRLEGVVTRSTPLMIVTEFMENGSLDTFLESRHMNGIELNVIQLVGMMRDISDGMRYLSDMGYVHRDLAARNVLVDENLVCKVSDFGLSRVLENIGQDDTAIYTTRGGMIPVRWTAPEAITRRTFTSSSDVWSFGITMWEVLTHGERPYWEMSNPDVVHCVECGYRLPPPAFCPRVLHNLMLNCWNHERTRRPSFSQIVGQLDNMLINPDRLQDTINNVSVHLQPECIPESLDLSSLGQWLEDMNMTHYKEIMLRHGCVTAEQIIKLSPNQLDEMGIVEPTMQNILLDGSEFLRRRLQEVQNTLSRGIPV